MKLQNKEKEIFQIETKILSDIESLLQNREISHVTGRILCFHDIWSKTTWSNVYFCRMLLFVETNVWSNFRRKTSQNDSLSKIQ